MNPPFELDNRGKRAIGIDYGTEAGRKVLADLIAGADVFVTNLRVDALERAGLDHAALTAAQPAARLRQRHRSTASTATSGAGPPTTWARSGHVRAWPPRSRRRAASCRTSAAAWVTT